MGVYSSKLSSPESTSYNACLDIVAALNKITSHYLLATKVYIVAHCTGSIALPSMSLSSTDCSESTQKLVDATNLDHLKHITIFFISGGENDVYTPETTDMSYTILRDKFDEGQYKHDVFEEFRNLDCWMGEKASEVVWLRIREHMVKVCGGLVG
jgi:hypothetical protein